MAIDDPRKLIDSLDDEILRLLEERARVVSDVALAKQAAHLPSYDPEREQQVLDRLAAQATRFPKSAIRAVYREVMSACLALQEQIKISYLGPEGTFSHAAARSLFGLAARYVEEATIEGVFDAVASSRVRYGVVPIVNSSEGSVNRTVDGLIESDGVRIRGELEMDVSHCLLTFASGVAAIDRVYSHPQALGQCRGWLSKNLANAQIIPTSSTTAAVRQACLDERSAAIASRLASEIYGLPIERESIQDNAENITRFVVIALDDAPRTGTDKTTLAFSVRDGRGALRRVLEIFDEEEVNLTSIESRPSREKTWDYIFLVDLEGHRDDPNVARMMARLPTACVTVKPVGSYPRSRKH